MLDADDVLAPAVIYEAGQSNVYSLNSRLFDVAKLVGNDLGVPTYATVVLGQSITSSDQTLANALSQITSLDADGWYFGFEFNAERIPTSVEGIRRCCETGLTLACTGKPVLHAYAGPTALLSLGFGATGVAVGHSQNLWNFSRSRWQDSAGTQGGGGDAPPRFFSASLWGTIVYPDEVSLLPGSLRSQVMIPSAFSVQYPNAWDRWSANKHLVSIIASQIATMSTQPSALANANSAVAVLTQAVNLHGQIAAAGIQVKDQSNAYQATWRTAMMAFIASRQADFAYLDLLS
jgi:hypothetical protein